MDKSMLRYFQIIGNIQTSISKSSTLKEALHNGLDTIIKECGVDYVVVWCEDIKGDSVLHPYYWICPIDISFKAHKNGEGSVGRVYRKQASERFLDYKKGQDKTIDEDFKGLKIESIVTVPLSNK